MEDGLQVGDDDGRPAEVFLRGETEEWRRKLGFREEFKGFCFCYLNQDFFVLVFDGLEGFLVLLPQIKVLQRTK